MGVYGTIVTIMGNNNSQTGFNPAEILRDSAPISADYALVLSFEAGLNKERVTEDILEVFVALSYDARTITLEPEQTSVILIENGIFDKKMRKSESSKIYNLIKDILGRYADDGLINVQLYYSVDYYDDEDDPRFEASRCVFTQTVSKLNALDVSFEDAIANKGKVNDLFRIVTTGV